MKPSRFNLYIPYGDEYLIFNTFRDSRVIIGEELRQAVEKAKDKKKLSREETEYLEELKEFGIMVDDEVNEDMELEYWLQKLKFDSSILSITLLTTYACNLRCRYCFQDGIRSQGYMDIETASTVIEWILDKMADVKPEVLRLAFYGGEPLLNKKVMFYMSRKLSRETVKRDVELEISLITNGVLLDDPLVDSLIPYGLKGIKVTLDGDEEAHNRNRPFKNGKGTFNRILSNLSKIKGKVGLNIGGNYDNSNIGSIPGLLDKLVELGFSGALGEVSFKPIFTGIESSGSCSSDIITFSDTDLKSILVLREEIKRRGFNPGDGVFLGPCEAIREYSYTIDPSGRIYKCGGFVGRDEFVIGDIYRGEFSPGNTEFMTHDIWKECKDCAYMPLCGGGCRVSSYIKHQGFRKPACEKEYFDRVAIEIVRGESE